MIKRFFTLLMAMMLFDTQLFSFFEAGTNWEMNSESTPTNATLGNRGGGTFNASIGSGGGVDYSTWQFPIVFGGLTTAGAGNVILSTSAAADWKGNGIYMIGGTNFNLSSPWWQITAVTVGVDFTVVPATSSILNISTGIGSAGAMNLGGALSGSGSSFPTLLTIEDTVFESLSASNTLYIKTGNGIYNWASITAVSSLYSASTGSYVEGYQTTRGDNPTPFGASTSAPVINMAASIFTMPNFMSFKNLKFIGTGTSIITVGIKDRISNIKIENLSTSLLRTGLVINSPLTYVENSEFVSGFGAAMQLSNAASDNSFVNGIFVHDSSTGIIGNTSSDNTVMNSIFASNYDGCINNAGAVNSSGSENLINNTFVGFDNVSVGTAVIITSTGGVNLINDIFYNFYSAINNKGLPISSNVNKNNSYFGIVSTFSGAANSVYFDTVTAWGVDPTFNNVTELFGTTATISATTLFMHQGGAFDNAGITDNADWLVCHRGTGSTNKAFKVIGHSSFSVTLGNTIGTNTTADKVWTIRTGKDFRINTNLKARGNPSKIAGSSTTVFIDLGAAQRAEASGSGSGGSFTFVQ